MRTGTGVVAEDAARALVSEGARTLVSFGLAGGLVADASTATPVVAVAVVSGAGGWRLDAAAPLAAEVEARTGALYTVDLPLLTVVDKRAARVRTGALAVDMESAHVLAVAAHHGLPALVVRVVADPVERALPRLAAVAVRPDGRLAPGATARALALHPRDWPLVAASARDTARARAGLRRAAAGLARLARQGLLERFLDVPVEDVGGAALLG
ncbi:MAG: phosphorylase [Alphaproteobacteria bacterium]|nr:phosphorylase [Alphaproteobacteria bacterium]